MFAAAAGCSRISEIEEAIETENCRLHQRLYFPCNVAKATAQFADMRENLPQAQDGLGSMPGRRFTMQPLSRSLGFAALSALALTVGGSPGNAEELAQSLGPVGPNEPILTTVGGKRVIAFYVPGNGHCGINVVVWDRSDASGDSAARVRISLNPRQTVHIDSAANKSINLQCGEYAETLALVDTNKLVAAGAAQ
jgi:hypothetical protein